MASDRLVRIELSLSVEANALSRYGVNPAPLSFLKRLSRYERKGLAYFEKRIFLLRKKNAFQKRKERA